MTGFEPNRLFEWTVGDPANKVARWRFALDPSGQGTTLRFSARWGRGPQD